MVFCSKCGEENNDGAVYCQKCGNRLKPEEKEIKGLLNLINIKAIIFGLISLVCILFSLILFFSEVSPYINFSLFFVQFSHFIGGLIAGLNSKKIYLSGMINGAIIGIPMPLIMIILDPMSIYILIEFWLRFCISGLIGGLVGVFLYKLYDKS